MDELKFFKNVWFWIIFTFLALSALTWVCTRTVERRKLQTELDYLNQLEQICQEKS